jgi:hypothetical protein
MAYETRYWMLDDPQSGTLVRRLPSGVFESFVGGKWGEHASLIWITMHPDSGVALPGDRAVRAARPATLGRYGFVAAA